VCYSVTHTHSLRVCVCVCDIVYVCVCVCTPTFLSLVYVGLFCVCVGLFCVHVGLFPQAQDTCAFIRGWVAKMYDQNTADNIRILYGAFIYIYMCVRVRVRVPSAVAGWQRCRIRTPLITFAFSMVRTYNFMYIFICVWYVHIISCIYSYVCVYVVCVCVFACAFICGWVAKK